MTHHEGKKPAEATEATANTLVYERVIDAPREAVWKAWTEPERMKRWWAPKPLTAPVIKIDPRVGGKFLGAMRFPDGNEFWSTGTYREIKPMERIVVTDSFADEQGNVVPGSRYGMSEDFPLELLFTISFADAGERTRLTVKHQGFPAGPDRDLAKEGFESSLDQLADSLKKPA